MEKKLAQECYEPQWSNPESNVLQNSSCIVTYLPSLKPFKSDEQDIQDTAGEVKASSYAIYSSGLLHTDKQVLDARQEPTNNSSI